MQRLNDEANATWRTGGGAPRCPWDSQLLPTAPLWTPWPLLRAGADGRAFAVRALAARRALAGRALTARGATAGGALNVGGRVGVRVRRHGFLRVGRVARRGYSVTITKCVVEPSLRPACAVELNEAADLARVDLDNALPVFFMKEGRRVSA